MGKERIGQVRKGQIGLLGQVTWAASNMTGKGEKHSKGDEVGGWRRGMKAEQRGGRC